MEEDSVKDEIKIFIGEVYPPIGVSGEGQRYHLLDCCYENWSVELFHFRERCQNCYEGSMKNSKFILRSTNFHPNKIRACASIHC